MGLPKQDKMNLKKKIPSCVSFFFLYLLPKRKFRGRFAWRKISAREVPLCLQREGPDGRTTASSSTKTWASAWWKYIYRWLWDFFFFFSKPNRNLALLDLRRSCWRCKLLVPEWYSPPREGERKVARKFQKWEIGGGRNIGNDHEKCENRFSIQVPKSCRPTFSVSKSWSSTPRRPCVLEKTNNINIREKMSDFFSCFNASLKILYPGTRCTPRTWPSICGSPPPELNSMQTWWTIRNEQTKEQIAVPCWQGWRAAPLQAESFPTERSKAEDAQSQAPRGCRPESNPRWKTPKGPGIDPKIKLGFDF